MQSILAQHPTKCCLTDGPKEDETTELPTRKQDRFFTSASTKGAVALAPNFKPFGAL